jgi:AcrR family transcriptional regulator
MRTPKYEQILSVAANLIATNGHDGASFQDIADKVGLHKSSLFHYFKNKEELLLGILEKPIEEVSKNLEVIIADSKLSPEEKFNQAIHNHLTLLTKYLDNVNVYLNDLRSLPKRSKALYMQKRKKYQKNFQRIVGEMKTKGYFNGCDAQVTTFGLLGMLNWTAKWYRKDGPLSIEEIGTTFCNIILHQNRTAKQKAIFRQEEVSVKR